MSEEELDQLEDVLRDAADMFVESKDRDAFVDSTMRHVLMVIDGPV